MNSKGQRRWNRWRRFIPLLEPLAWVLVRFPPLSVALANQGLKHALKQAEQDIAEQLTKKEK